MTLANAAQELQRKCPTLRTVSTSISTIVRLCEVSAQVAITQLSSTTSGVFLCVVAVRKASLASERLETR